MNIIRILVGAAAITSVACSQQNLMQERQRTAAPKGSQDLGVVLEGAQSDEVESLLGRHPAAQVRVLNREHGMYELFGVTKEEAQAQTRGQAETNMYFTLQSADNRNYMSKLAAAAPVGLKIGGLNACKNASSGPTAKLEALQPASLADASIELGKTVKVSGAKSEAAVRSVILVAAPGAASNRQTIVDQADYSFTPEALGVYQIYLVVQDRNDVCSIDGVRFIVTANRPYTGPKADELRIDFKKLSHLGQVSAEESWQNSQGAGIVIAVIDTGVNYNHPALAPAILLNSAEIPGNGRDDDGNGFADDELGYDFVNSDAFPYDDDSHGTHVSGAAVGRPFGLANKAKLLPIKALTGIGGDVASISAAIRYAVDRGAKVINMSLGAMAPMAHPTLVTAVAYAEKKGVLIIAAAGNGDANGLGIDIDQMPSFPASMPNDNIVSVAAFDAENVMSVYSNFGKVAVDVVAPGGLNPNDPMISAAFENPKKALFIGMTGTSMATPVVAGIAAQVWSLAPQLSVLQVKNILIQAGTLKPELKDVTVSGRHINAEAAVRLALDQAVLF